jgi:MOSC domain-containing protein YiiM
MGEPRWIRTFTEVGRSGAYLAIVTGGTVRRGDSIRVLAQATHDVPLPVVFAAYMGDVEAARVVLAADFLPDEETEWLQERVERKGR